MDSACQREMALRKIVAVYDGPGHICRADYSFFNELNREKHLDRLHPGLRILFSGDFLTQVMEQYSADESLLCVDRMVDGFVCEGGNAFIFKILNTFWLPADPFTAVNNKFVLSVTAVRDLALVRLDLRSSNAYRPAKNIKSYGLGESKL